tara:strand:- start:471 stop:1223 length:753 start_codon:yes stop_codon:yes gene_type:complete
MNKLILCIAVFLLSFTLKATVKEDFKQANSHYNNSEYEEAKVLYSQLLIDGHFSAALYYNLGNVYYKLNEVGPAILYYEKANKLNPLNKDIRHNLAFAYKLTVDKEDNVDNEILSAWWGTVVKYQPLNRWALYSVFLLLFSVCFAVGYLFTDKRVNKQVSFYGSLILFISFFLVLFIGFESKRMLELTTHGIVFSPSVTIVSEPNDQATKLFTLHEGAKVELLNIDNDWTRIQFAEDKIGWLKSDVVQGI